MPARRPSAQGLPRFTARLQEAPFAGRNGGFTSSPQSGQSTASAVTKPILSDPDVPSASVMTCIVPSEGTYCDQAINM
jgi:hypothetical protein